MHTNLFQGMIVIFAGMLISQSAFGAAFVTPFYSRDFEAFDEQEILRDRFFYEPGGGGANWQYSAFELKNSQFVGIDNSQGRFASGIGNPNKAIEATADFTSGLLAQPRLEIKHASLSDDAVVSGLTDPDTRIQVDFDLWTSQTSAVLFSIWMEPPNRQGETWRGRSREVVNDRDEWQRHSITFYAFGDPEDRQSRASLYEGIGVDWMSWRIDSGEWGTRSQSNIIRLDNIEMGIIVPEPSAYAFFGGCFLIAFSIFRRMKIMKIMN